MTVHVLSPCHCFISVPFFWTVSIFPCPATLSESPNPHLFFCLTLLSLFPAEFFAMPDLEMWSYHWDVVIPAEFLAHLSQRLTRWAYRIGLEPASVCVCPLTISNMNISKTRGPIATKFYLKHQWGGGKPALGFGPGQIRTLVSMATDSSHRVIMGKTASPRFLCCFWSDPFHTCR